VASSGNCECCRGRVIRLRWKPTWTSRTTSCSACWGAASRCYHDLIAWQCVSLSMKVRRVTGYAGVVSPPIATKRTDLKRASLVLPLQMRGRLGYWKVANRHVDSPNTLIRLDPFRMLCSSKLGPRSHDIHAVVRGVCQRHDPAASGRKPTDSAGRTPNDRWLQGSRRGHPGRPVAGTRSIPHCLLAWFV
jgi:hypothetical protein